MNPTDAAACPVCGEASGREFLMIPDVPCHVGLLWDSVEAARDCPRGDLRLFVCETCAFIWNRDFDPARMEYSQAYDNCLHYSGTYQSYAEDVAQRLVHDHGLRGRRIVEIGCGKGDFLALLIRLGDNRGWGFDPSYDGRYRDLEESGRLRVQPDFFGPSHAEIGADLTCSRYVFEHVPRPLDFLANVRSACKPATRIYFEVPNGLFILRDESIWDLIYEHCSYFTTPSLNRCFTECGFSATAIREQFGGQFLAIEALPNGEVGKPASASMEMIDPTRVLPYVEAFPQLFRRRREEWREKLKGIRSATVWGAGAKAVSFLNWMDQEGAVDRVVDINPAKQGKFMAGTGQPIIAPEKLADRPPSRVIVMNPIYLKEIRERLAALGIRSDVEAAA